MSMHRKILRIGYIWRNRDNKFIVEIPELPGCMADGITESDALKNADQVISEWIETARSLGREIPQPKGQVVYV